MADDADKLSVRNVTGNVIEGEKARATGFEFLADVSNRHLGHGRRDPKNKNDPFRWAANPLGKTSEEKFGDALPFHPPFIKRNGSLDTIELRVQPLYDEFEVLQ